jgi:hypothetical protein
MMNLKYHIHKTSIQYSLGPFLNCDLLLFFTRGNYELLQRQ